MREFHMHLVSDATGETVISATRACVAQFDGVKPVEHFWNLVRTQRQLNLALEGIREKPGIVIYTLVDQDLRAKLESVCRELPVPCIPMLDPILKGLSAYLGLESKAQPGLQHTMGEEYFSRLDAMDFAMSQDDGQSPTKLYKADVILVGVSRTSKTPTCIYLANRGIKAGNIPFVPGVPLPEILTSDKAPMIVGLTEDPERLVSIRRNRLLMLNQTEITSYADLEEVRKEVNEARRFYTKMGWPVIDVTRRSIEETAAEIIKILARKRPAAEAPSVLSETIILASGSATRRAILRSAGLSILTDPANVDEGAIKIDCAARGLDAAVTAQRLARAKAEAVAPRHAGSIVLGADQMLSCDGKWFDKPSDRMAAAAQIMQLSGKIHRLISAICAIRDETLLWSATQTAEMTMRPLSDAFLESYLDREGDLILNSVGGYRIEGSGIQLFSDIQGDYFTILGLPLLPLLSFLRERGVLPQ